MIQISQAEIQRGVERALFTEEQPQQAVLKTTSLDVLRAPNNQRVLTPDQKQMLQALDHGMREVSRALALTLHSALGDGKDPANLDAISLDPDIAARRLALCHIDTLHKLCDCVMGKDEVSKLKASLAGEGPAKDAALQTLAETLLASASDSTAIVAIVGILAMDPQNENIRIIYLKAMELLTKLRLLATSLLRDIEREAQAKGRSSFTDILAPRHSQTTAAVSDDANDQQSTALEFELKKGLTEAAARMIQASAALREVQQLREELKKLTDEMQLDYARSLNGPQDEQYASRVRFNQEQAAATDVARKLRDAEADIPV